MDIETLSRTLQTIFGIGLVIFVHELGHFLAARMCRVRVEVFSMGFGPKLLGWQRGDTLYQLALLPIGGFCRMAGEDPERGNAAPRPDELRAQSVGRRFFIYSGGVLMNVIFGAVVLPLVLFHGVSMDEPLIGYVEPGSPAWVAGLEPGTRVQRINDEPVASFENLIPAIALGPEDACEMVVQGPRDAEARTVVVHPKYDEELGLVTIGVSSSGDPRGAIRVQPEGPAALAGLTDADRLSDVAGSAAHWTLDEKLRYAMRNGEPIEIQVLDAVGAQRALTVEPTWTESTERRLLGVFQVHNVVLEARDDRALTRLGLQLGDQIVRANGVSIQRASDLSFALARELTAPTLELVRDGERITNTLQPFDALDAHTLASHLHLGADRTRVVVGVSARAAVAGVLRDGDRILAANGVKLADWSSDFLPIAQSAADTGATLALRVQRVDASGASSEFDVTVSPGPQWSPDYGFGPLRARYVYRSSSVGEALRVGFMETWRIAANAWTMLKGMLLGSVSPRHMGGIVGISMVTYEVTELGLSKLLFFLCVLSVNLAFINVLPVPLLDGGHLLFLIIEKIKGSPVSERVFGYSQVVGLVLILFLVLYVTYNDVMRAVSW